MTSCILSATLEVHRRKDERCVGIINVHMMAKKVSESLSMYLEMREMEWQHEMTVAATCFCGTADGTKT